MANTLLTSLLAGGSFAVFTLAGRRALEMRSAEKYRTSWGAWFWAFLPGLVSAAILTTDGATPVDMRNWILGALGGLVGVCAAIYLGYVATEWRTASSPLSSLAATGVATSRSDAGSSSTITAPDNQGIVTSGQSGGNNTVGR